MRLLEYLKELDRETLFKDWEKSSFYPRDRKRALRLLEELLALTPVPSDRELVFVPLFNADFNDSYDDYTLERSIDVFVLDEDPNKRFALTFIPLAEVLGMKMHQRSLEKVSTLDIVGGLLTELSFFGDTVEEIEKEYKLAEENLEIIMEEVEEGEFLSFEDFSDGIDEIRKKMAEIQEEVQELLQKRKKQKDYIEKVEREVNKKNKDAIKDVLGLIPEDSFE